MDYIRAEHDSPMAIESWGWRYHHMGIPTKQIMPDETYIPHLKMYVSGFPASPFGIEWMRFELDSPVHSVVKSVPHVAFQVDDLEHELIKRNLKVITSPNTPVEGIKVAMIEHNGAPVELIEFNTK